MNKTLILASGSEIRRKLLSQVGLKFSVVKPLFDERSIKDDKDDASLALRLAFAKACEVSEKHQDSLVIGCDQILEFEKKICHKLKSIAEARQRLLDFNGKEHFLYSAISLVKNKQKQAEIVKKSSLKLYKFSEKDIDNYLAKAGKDIINSVACYQIENIGLNLFEEIKGNLYDIMGLPLFELLKILKNYGFNGLDM